MKNILTIIYKFSQDQMADIPDLSGRYEVVKILAQSSSLSNNLIHETYVKICQKPFSSQPMFNSLEQLKSFILELCEVSDAKEAILITVDDYNLAMKSIVLLDEYQDCLRQFGTILNNDQFKKSFKLRNLNPFTRN